MKTMLMQIFGVTTKEHYGMLWYFLEWSILKWCTCVFFHHQRVPYRPEYLKHRAEKNYIRCLCYVGYSVCKLQLYYQ